MPIYGHAAACGTSVDPEQTQAEPNFVNPFHQSSITQQDPLIQPASCGLFLCPRSITMKEFAQMVGEAIVQLVRDYPKGFLIVLAVVVVLGIIF